MPAAYKRCLKHVQGRVRNPHAACTAVNAGGIQEYRKREAAQRARRKKRKRRKGGLIAAMAEGRA